MKFEFTIADSALEDMADVWTFYQQLNSEESAQRLIDEVFDLIEQLKVFPEMGERRDQLRRGLRKIRVRQHLIFYVFEKNMVMVVRVLHARRDFEAIFDA
jgi:toxin ParE1/3/4